ncbi:Phage tail assembly chaperone protein OS=Bosea thiooxidans OX=53254 GN=SAMN05660750_04076 PE=4 SV=1 [Bosea thiooxidans]|uniref:Uncharacterized protein n=1 Tax=Bosea thiooxidans TaxID=53254 RepID=A0A1T5GI40_9HYPH|nr:hypothetical protein [Bosea thiooxidans]SKC08093.1 hypothetical protein SAMN05660750_04076 [Bosea thiooxidans]
MELQFRRPDGSFVAIVNGLPYHIIEGDPLYAEAEQAGQDLPFEPVPEPVPVTLDDFRRAIQAHIDATASQRSYDSGITCASYVGSTNPTWAAEAAAFTAWRDTVWTFAHDELAKVEGGQRPQPTVDAIILELPGMAWPA